MAIAGNIKLKIQDTHNTISVHIIDCIYPKNNQYFPINGHIYYPCSNETKMDIVFFPRLAEKLRAIYC